ncbi:MAG: DNA/RNA helicase domain-containing protein [Acidobacteriota bacterium]
MASFYRSTVQQFLAAPESEIQAALAHAYASFGYTRQFTDQTLTWKRDVERLRAALEQCVLKSQAVNAWGVLLEFTIPRKEARIDAIVLAGDTIIVLEAKSADISGTARRQIEEYALLLHYFHQASRDRTIIPLLVSAEAPTAQLDPLRQKELFRELPTFWVKPVLLVEWAALAETLLTAAGAAGQQLTLEEWDDSVYAPVPSILEAAIALKSGLSIREISYTEASQEEIEAVHRTVQAVIDRARTLGEHAICFLTGVPGSGKTLIGLSLAHSEQNKVEPIHFMSGNGPLVHVLQHLFTTHDRRQGTSATQARVNARTLIENVHKFASHYTERDTAAPSNHAVIFDEAQRAWNREQNYRKFKRDYSEPEMLLRIMERHRDWAVIIALVGGGQEINSGEAGLEEWGKAIAAAGVNWRIYASPEVLSGGTSTAGHRLFELDQKEVHPTDTLHLRTSRRSLRAETLAAWVNHVLAGECDAAAKLRVTDRYPIFLSRDLNQVRTHLFRQSIGENRCGLIGSSGAARLRAEGLEPSSSFHRDYQWEHWYLAERSDVRSSHRCEVFATEFEIQGLELDWIGLCWGGDFIWDGKRWVSRNLRCEAPSRWLTIKNSVKQTYRSNAYRVLLTRSRKGMILFVPQGDPLDGTRNHREFDLTAEFLQSCGARVIV